MFKTMYNKFDLIMPTSETGSPKILLGVQSIITTAFYITIFSRSKNTIFALENTI